MLGYKDGVKCLCEQFVEKLLVMCFDSSFDFLITCFVGCQCITNVQT